MTDYDVIKRMLVTAGIAHTQPFDYDHYVIGVGDTWIWFGPSGNILKCEKGVDNGLIGQTAGFTVIPKEPPQKLLAKCVCHSKRRMCMQCGCCAEYVCREGGWKLDKSTPPEPVCDVCREEGADYARYGIFGPPY